MQVPIRRDHLQIYVLAPNLLAGRYLVQILAAEHTFRPILCECLPEGASKEEKAIFVFDNSFLLLPLGECVRRLQSRFPAARYVVVDTEQSEQEIVRLLKLGVHGFVAHSDVHTLRHAVQVVAAGDFWIPRHILRIYVELTARPDYHRRNPAAMTLREMNVLELVERHLSNKEIATVLGVRESTVKYHISNILGKFQVGSRQDLTLPVQSVRFWQKFLH